MGGWDFARSISGIRLLAELGASHGLAVKQVLAGTGIRQRDLDDAGCVVSAEQELRLIRNLLAHLRHVPALGVEAGLRYHYSTFGSLGFAMVTSRHARQALDVALRYFNLTHAFTRFVAADSEQEVGVTIDADHVPEDVRRFIIERDVAALVAIQRELIAVPEALHRVEFEFPMPADTAPYVRAFGRMPAFGAGRTVVVFARAPMLLPLPQANEVVLKYSEEQCVRILERHRARVGLAARVRERLARNIELGMEEVAAALCMTSRTLRRQLTQEGTAFTMIRDEARIALAEEYLVVLKLSVDETGYRLGYLSCSAFITAFRRLTGETPLAFRKRLEGEAGAVGGMARGR
ncbi:AraC family transcriptional regulator [Duganella sp. LX20W]|uniref:AraC family transcriptional regulator n=1 Tax=Rugamonas brunnea TaxID=2758569 RepID=A0A7W2EWD8_9BURK|nr:AraC family transcriptional regulator [Rugamonas brunnea]MBA5639863.1 AraC family transcriptional regulator [Rugamonas brunnea]